MQSSFEICLPRVLAHEGGYVNDPDDPGGPTNRGVTQRVYNGFRVRKGLAPRSVRLITADEVGEIYRRQYWDAVRGDDLPVGLDYAVFDFAVNSGVSRAIRYLQRVLKVTQDGIIGERTLAAARESDVMLILEAYVEARMKFLMSITKGGGWKKFGRGWRRRVLGEQDGIQDGDSGVIDVAAMMINEQAVPMPSMPAPGKAIVEERESFASSTIAQSTVLDVVTKVGAGAAIIPQLDTNVQILFGAALLLMVLLSFIIFRQRLRAWAEGWK